MTIADRPVHLGAAPRRTLAPLILVLDRTGRTAEWQAAFSIASSRHLWPGALECRYLSYCLHPLLWTDPALIEAWYGLEAGRIDIPMAARSLELAMGLLCGNVAGSVYRPLPSGDGRVLALAIPGDAAIDLELGAMRFRQRHVCAFWNGGKRLDTRTDMPEHRPNWHPSLSIEACAARIVDATHALGHALGELRHLGLAAAEGRNDFWA